MKRKRPAKIGTPTRQLRCDTALATPLAMLAGRRGKKVRFRRVIELVIYLMKTREVRNLHRIKSQLPKLELMVLD